MLFGKYDFRCTFNTPALLPRYKGSTLRGGFGRALRRTSCALRRKDCRDCLLSATCAYALIFEAKKNPALSTQGHSAASAPHPYLLKPPLETKRSYAAGDEFSFSLCLFGKANDYLPHIVYAVQQMGESGIGSRKDQHPGTFTLQGIAKGNETIYDPDTQMFRTPEKPDILKLAPPPENVREVHLRLLTPLRLKRNNRFHDRLPFHLLVRAALRRISSLENAYGDGEPELDYPGLVAKADMVETISQEYAWVELERHSARQRTNMLIGGLQGSLTFHGQDLAPFLALLRYCETVHLGKQTTFGLGWIEIKEKA